MLSHVRQMSSLSTTKPWRIRLPQKLKGGFLQKWGDYWVTVAQDYKEVAFELAADSRKHPVKAGCYISLISGLIYAVKTNPDLKDYEDTLQEFKNESSMLSSKIRNPEVDSHFNYMVDCYTHGLVRRLSIGFCSFLWVDNYSKECGVFKSQCEYLKPRYLTFHQRIVDVGFLGRWWVIDRKMKDFDINPNEWPVNEANESVFTSGWKTVKEAVSSTVTSVLLKSES